MAETFRVFRASYSLIVDREKCDLCGKCVEVCPARCLAMGRSSLVVESEKCIACYACVLLCERGALRLEWRLEALRGP
ncbi:MAG: 4Fe-4S binding protein [Fervidicoccaceae archaeon]